MRITVEINIPFFNQTFNATFPQEMKLNQLIYLLFNHIHEECYEGIGIYLNDGSYVDDSLNAIEANIVDGMKLYIV